MNYKMAFFVTALAVAVSVPVFATDSLYENSDDSNTGDVASSENMLKVEKRKAKKEITAEQAACIRTAVGNREVLVSGAFSTFSSGISTALTTRAAALSTAWGITTNVERKQAVRTAWNAYKRSTQVTRKTFRDAKRSAWSTFKTDVKACSVEVSATGENEGLDQQ